jgi:hypothetical protein
LNILMMAHISAGAVALLAGAAALAVPKGRRLHVRAGTVFFGSMLAMTFFGAWVALSRSHFGTALIATITAYLVATAWMAATRRKDLPGPLELGALMVALACAGLFLNLGFIAVDRPSGTFDGMPPAVFFSYATLGTLAAALDVNYILRREISGRQRIARHVWRMCAALLIAALSFFLGQQKAMPIAIRGSPLLALPPIMTFVLMIFWLFRVRFAQIYDRYPARGLRKARLAAQEPLEAPAPV